MLIKYPLALHINYCFIRKYYIPLSEICLKYIVTDVYEKDEYSLSDACLDLINIMSKTCLEYCGVTYEGFPPEMQRDFLVSLKADIGVKMAEEQEQPKMGK